MSGLIVGLAIALPWIVGTSWLRRLWSESFPGRWPLLLGYGYIVGWVGLTILLRLWAFIGLPVSVPAVMSILVTLAAIAVYRPRRQTYDYLEIVRHRRTRSSTVWRSGAIILILSWLGIRFTGIALEVWWQPLFPWDAWTTWALRARVWSELSELAPFVSPDAWLADTKGRSYNIEAWNYPPTVSLIAAWPALAFGRWSETLANLPWLGCALALGLGFYGQARRWGASSLTAAVFLWFLMSLPVLNTHIALAGYADLWLATTLGFAFMSFLLWLRDRDRKQGLMFVLFALASALIKIEGSAWTTLFVAAWLGATLRWRWQLGLLAIAAALAVIIAMSGEIAGEIPWIGRFAIGTESIELPHLGRFDLAPAGAWEPIQRHFFLYDNWHLLIYFLTLSLGWGALHATRQSTAIWTRAAFVWVLTSLLAFFVLFFWTDASIWAIKATSTNRILLHFVPAYVFWMMALWMLFPVSARRTQLSARPRCRADHVAMRAESLDRAERHGLNRSET